ncbi:MAG: DUF934 domain-containing protein [Pseudomonadales bacterium]
MPTIIKDKSITETPFSAVSAEDADTMASNVLLPLAFWLEHQEELEGRNDVGVWVDADEEVEVLAGFVNSIPVIGLNFPNFYDGRSLSSATILRRTFGYEGELRAIGDVRRDQMEQMQRCGINAFELAQGQDPEKALASLEGFTYNYQVSVDRPAPLFRQR